MDMKRLGYCSLSEGSVRGCRGRICAGRLPAKRYAFSAPLDSRCLVLTLSSLAKRVLSVAGSASAAGKLQWRLTLNALPTAARLPRVILASAGRLCRTACTTSGLYQKLRGYALSCLRFKGILPAPLLPLYVFACTATVRTMTACWGLVGGVLSNTLGPDTVQRAACAIAPAGVPSMAASDSVPVLTRFDCATARFSNIADRCCVLNTAPFSSTGLGLPPTPSMSGVDLGPIFCLAMM